MMALTMLDLQQRELSNEVCLMKVYFATPVGILYSYSLFTSDNTRRLVLSVSAV